MSRPPSLRCAVCLRVVSPSYPPSPRGPLCSAAIAYYFISLRTALARSLSAASASWFDSWSFLAPARFFRFSFRLSGRLGRSLCSAAITRWASQCSGVYLSGPLLRRRPLRFVPPALLLCFSFAFSISACIYTFHCIIAFAFCCFPDSASVFFSSARLPLRRRWCSSLLPGAPFPLLTYFLLLAPHRRIAHSLFEGGKRDISAPPADREIIDFVSVRILGPRGFYNCVISFFIPRRVLSEPIRES